MQIELDKLGRQQAKDLIDKVPSKPRYVCKIEPYSRQRSIEQNKRHWARMEQVSYWMCKLHNKCKDKEIWHYWFAGQCYGWVDTGMDGKSIPSHTKWRNTKEFNDMEELIDEKTDDWGFYLRDQDEWTEYKRAAGI